MEKLTLTEAALHVCGLKVWPIPRDWTGKEKELKRAEVDLLKKRMKAIEGAVDRREFGTVYRNGERSEPRDIERDKLEAFAKTQGWSELAQPAGDAAASGASRSASNSGKIEHTNTLRVLGLVALVLAQKVSKFKVGDTVNAKQVADAIEGLAADLGLKTRGLGGSAVRAKVKEAVQLVANEVLPKKKTS